MKLTRDEAKTERNIYIPGIAIKFPSHCNITHPQHFSFCRFSGGQVYLAKKLSSQDGVLSCSNLCRDSIDCWSWNFDKRRKMCYLMASTVSDMSSERAGSWASGYRQCESAGEGWDNVPYAPGSGDLTPVPTPTPALTPTPTPTPTPSTTVTRIRNQATCLAYSVTQLNGCFWNFANECCHCPSCNCPYKDCKKDT